QTHVGTLPPACAAGAVGAVFVALRARRDRSALTSLAATIVVTLVVWLPSIVEQATRRPGNLSALWQFFAAGLGTGQPFRTAFIDWANMLTGVVRPGFYLAHGWTLRLGRSPQIQALAIGEL